MTGANRLIVTLSSARAICIYVGGDRMRPRRVNKELSQAWLEAAQDLGIRVTAPFTIRPVAGDPVTYEAYLPDFGGPKGTVVGTLEETDYAKRGDLRQEYGYLPSDIAETLFNQYDRETFIRLLNQWHWHGEDALRPTWYTGESSLGKEPTEAERRWLIRQGATEEQVRASVEESPPHECSPYFQLSDEQLRDLHTELKAAEKMASVEVRSEVTAAIAAVEKLLNIRKNFDN